MSLFWTLKNGTPQWAGSMSVTGSVTASSVTNAATAAFNWTGRAQIISTADAQVAIVDSANSTGAVLTARSVNYNAAASTFAQTATITNGPRAANPVSWVEVYVNGSSGRMPVW